LPGQYVAIQCNATDVRSATTLPALLSVEKSDQQVVNTASIALFLACNRRAMSLQFADG